MKAIEAKKGDTIFFTEKSNSAAICKFKNNKSYFVSEINKEFIGEKEYSNIKNGESFFIDDISIANDDYKTVKIHLLRKINNTKFILRWEDITYFSGVQ